MNESARKSFDPKLPVQFSDYVVYVDESGDHGLDSMEPTYPMFVLAFCIFHKETYIQSITPDVQRFKFRHFGHDMVVLHEREIRKAIPPFAFLTDRAKREPFMQEVADLIDGADFKLIATAIFKQKLKDRYPRARNPYHIALRFGLERVAKFLRPRIEAEQRTHVIVERRGRNEDDELELEFRRICGSRNDLVSRLPLEIVFADKRVNSCGLQFADLIARPIGRHLLDGPAKPNRAYEVIKRKFDRSPAGTLRGWGLKVFP